jgi:hypothetical protein
MSTYDEALEAFDKYEDGKMTERITAALAPLADMHVDIWVEAYMLGYANGMKGGAEASWKTTWNKGE